MTEEFKGADELRGWLQGQGFKIDFDPLSSVFNKCNWMAFRRTALESRPCECNEKPVQILITPYVFYGVDRIKAEVNICGEAGGIWYEIKAYSITQEDLMARPDEIEASLVRAWNAALENQWQPIETAPKDKQVFLMDKDGNVETGYIYSEGWCSLGCFIPAHWMPIPKKPV